MLSITNHQGIGITMRYLFTPLKGAIIKEKQITSVGKDMKKREPLVPVCVGV